MALRVDDVPLDNTKKLMQRIMPVIRSDQRVLFLCPAGGGHDIVQRIRVMMSRARKKLRRSGKKVQHFKTHHTIHSHTEGGIRYDAVIMWRSRSSTHVLNELLEDMFGETE